MGGCTNCVGKSGCDHRKGSMLEAVADWMERLYPTRSWGEIDDELAFASGVDPDDARALAEELGGELNAATVFVEGGSEDLCDFIYVLCQGREPCAMQIRYGDVPMPEELGAEDVISESYLRIALSSVAPMAVVQQARVTMRCIDGMWTLKEELAAGVYDAPLLRRFQRLVALLPAYDLLHLDMGEISSAPEGFAGTRYSEMFGRPPDVLNYLFYRHPSNTVSLGPLL